MNGGACGLIRQSACNLTNVLKIFLGNILFAFFEEILTGTAWLSSVRVVECYIYLLNERNLQCKCQKTS